MKRIVLLLCLTAFLYNCSTESTSDNPEPESNFYALTVGNSWVYKNYRLNPANQFYEDTGVIDSVSIVGTETLNDNLYYKFRRWTTGNEEGITFCNPNGEHFELLRDSLGYLIRDDGSLKFINENFDDHLIRENNWGDEYFQLQQNMVQINLPSGSFDSKDVLHYALIHPDNLISPGTNNYYYADGIGNVFETHSFVSQETHVIEKRLDSYNIIN